MKRLLCIINTMNTGGAETFMMKIYRALDKNEYQIDFCINDSETCYYEKEINSLGGKVFRIPQKTKSIKGYKKALFDVVKNNGYKYVMRVTSNAAGFLDLKIAKKAGAKVLVARSSNSSDGSVVKGSIHNISRMILKKYVNVKIAPSDLAAIYTFGKGDFKSGKVSILKNAVDLKTFKFDEDARKQVRREFSLDDETFLWGHIGRFARQKNHEFLIEAFAKYHKKNNNSALLLVGDGNLKAEIEQRAERLNVRENIIFAGIRADIPRLLSAMDVFVFPSFYEGMPNTVIEAQATGLRCVVSDKVTTDANITKSVTYLPIENPNEWADYILNLKKSERKTPCDAFLENGYDIEASAKEFVKMIFG